MDMANNIGAHMSSIELGDESYLSPLAGSYPVRAPVWWGRRGESTNNLNLPGVSGRFVVLVHKKTFKRLEKILAKILRAPSQLRRPLDEMNSLLWELCDGRRSFESIVSLMDETFEEQIAPVTERTEAALRQLGERGFIIFSHSKFEYAWPTGPGIDPNGELDKIDGIDSNPIDGDEIE
ncbi:MAG: hypothetical protein CMO20_06300 [Thermoplasmata archaeon]|nr:hypothetical protein [Thermoplasmata archaeon]|tara:strand:+ start:1023 stop:1559 length:537 start_codon:yes stop_codon:yes gene_type:complete